MLKLSSNTSTRKCVGVRPIPHYQILMVRMKSNQTIIPYNRAEMGTVDACFIHAITGKETSNLQLNFSERHKIYFVASNKYAGLYHILKWYEDIYMYSCSCLEGKRHGWCLHQQQLEDHLGIPVA